MFLGYQMKLSHCHIDVTDVTGGFRTMTNICNGAFTKKKDV